MRKQGGLIIIFILALMGAGFFYAQNIEAAGKININTATLGELDALPGIGPAKAQAIIDYRGVKLFEKIEDIMKVSGIKQAAFNDIKNLITVDAAADGQALDVVVNVKASADKAEDYLEIDLEKAGELKIGSLVKVKGAVAAPPGILGAQIFYLASASTSAPAGLKIYNYKKDFPALRLGDYVEISGELALAPGELMIKTKAKDDIKINEHQAPPAALAVSCDQVNEKMAGRLITVSGEITDKKSAMFYLDDGNNEISVYVKKNTGIKTKSLAVGQTAAVTGILIKAPAGLRLLPRYQSDIAITDSDSALPPQVLGQAITSEEWALAARDKKMELFKYLLIIAGGIIIILAVLFVRSKRKSA